MLRLQLLLNLFVLFTVDTRPQEHAGRKHVHYLKKLFAPVIKDHKRNDVIRKISRKEEAVRGQLYAGTDVNTGYGGVGLSGASLGVLNILSYVHAFDTRTGMPYVCDPFKKKPDEKIDNRWHMIVPPCPDFKKCLFPWKEAKDCETKIDDNPATSSKRWFVEPILFPVLIPVRGKKD